MAACLAVILLAGVTNQSTFTDDSATCFTPVHKAAVGSPIPKVVSEEILNDLIGWIAIHTSYDLLQAYQSPPTLSFCAVGEIVDYEGNGLLVEEGLWATFDHTNRHIYLVRPWSLFNVFDQSTLLHEMIHDIQLSNREWDCLGAPELEAYLLQDKWLQEHGIYHQFNWPAIIRMSQCTGEDDVE